MSHWDDIFKDVEDFRKCGVCFRSVRNVFLIPSCDHALCEDCAQTPPDECPICHGMVIPEDLTPDLLFREVWDIHFNVTPVKRSSESIIKNAETMTDKARSYMKRNAKGETVLHQYCTLGLTEGKGFSLETLKKMISDGANPNTFDGSGVSPIHEAVWYDNLDILEVLLSGGALVNCYHQKTFTTPLHDAVTKYFAARFTEGSVPYKIICTLLNYGADVNLKDGYRRSAVRIAEETNVRILNLLKSYQPPLIERKILHAPEPPTVVLPCVGNDKKALDDVKKFVKTFKIKCLPHQGGFKHEVTHVLVPDATESANFTVRQAILSRVYIVKMKWVVESVKRNAILPAEDFEIRRPLTPNGQFGYVSRRARYDRLRMMPELFAGGQFHLMASIATDLSLVEKSQLYNLIEIGGGGVMTREPKSADFGENRPYLFHAPEGSEFEKCSVFILYSRPPRAMYTMTHMKHVPVSWIFQCIDTYSICEQ